MPKKVDASELTRTQPDMHDFLRRSPAKLPLSTYMSRVDGGDAEEPFWPKDPRQAMRDGDYDRSIPWVNGVTSMEGSWYAVAMLGRGKGGGAWAAEGNLRCRFVQMSGCFLYISEFFSREFNADKDRALYTMCLKDVYPREASLRSGCYHCFSSNFCCCCFCNTVVVASALDVAFAN